jgi:hypothetical protein
LPTAGIVNNAVTLAKMAGITRGSIIYGNASGDPTALAKGCANEVLTSDGTDIAWAAASGGGALTLINSEVASCDCTLDITGLSSTYDTYLLLISDVVPATDAQNLYLRFGDSGGFDSGASDYTYQTMRSKGNGLHAEGNKSEGAAQIIVSGGVGNAAGEGVSSTLWLGRPGDGTMQPTIHGMSSYTQEDTSLNRVEVVGNRAAVITLDRVQVFFASGAIKTGRFSVYGVGHT